MRVNVYAEEMTDRVELVTKVVEGTPYVGIRFYLYLPVSTPTPKGSIRGPFMHRDGDDDSAAVTFWGKRELRTMLTQALELLDRNSKVMDRNDAKS